MTATTRTLSATALVLALGSALSMAAVSTVHAADADMEKCFGVAMKGQKRLRRRCRHHLCRHVENGLPGQRLETRSERHLRHHREQDLADRFRSDGSVQSQVLILRPA